jgi:hypothetical protein
MQINNMASRHVQLFIGQAAGALPMAEAVRSCIPELRLHPD